MSETEFKAKMSMFEFLLGEQYGTFIVQMWDDCYVMGTDRLAYMIKFPYPMYRAEAMEALLYTARNMANER